MESSKKHQRCSDKQIVILLEYMEKHTLFARKQITKLGPRGHERYRQMWEQLSTLLNNHGPTIKDVEGWTTVWKNLRLFCKNKKAAYIKEKNKTGNPSINLKALTNIEERVCAIFGKYGSGELVLREIGLHGKNQISMSGKQLNREPTSLLLTRTSSSKHHCEEPNLFPNRVLAMAEQSSSTAPRRTKEKKDRQRPTREQFHAMVAYIEENPLLIDGVISIATAHIWKDLTAKLNALPNGAVREMRAWTVSWRDLKNRVRQRREEIMHSTPGTESNPLRTFNLRVLKIIDSDGSSVLETATETPRSPLKLLQDDHRTENNSEQTSNNKRANIIRSSMRNYKSTAIQQIIDLTEEDTCIRRPKVKKLSESNQFLDALGIQNNNIQQCSASFVNEIKNLNTTINKGITKIVMAIQNKKHSDDNTEAGIIKTEKNEDVQNSDEENTEADINFQKHEFENDELINLQEDADKEYEVTFKYEDL